MAILSGKYNRFRLRVALVSSIHVIIRFVEYIRIDVHCFRATDDRRGGPDADGKTNWRRRGPPSDNLRHILRVHRFYPECRLVQYIFSPFARRHFGNIEAEGQGGSSVSYSCNYCK
ncbi:hypothetical protein M7I_6062 [Glarea lozoyensis 74030]|uniref:Uncharacterized protein n=1 Tax=Glarea lozoyensis (strain ATCC 74030 / MF5533) TaxID=1104152 RepID=H0ETJ8_GLAL7|nr:hypothetical protein M7I_6062 [Glarea lozoyensis 74030]